MLKTEHIGIAVKDLALSIALYEKLLDTACYKTESIASENVETAFLRAGETKIELVAAITDESVVAKFIEKRGEGLHHIAFEVTDIYVEIKRLQKEGFTVLNDAPKKGADNKLVCFISPKDCSGVLIELCQEINAY